MITVRRNPNAGFTTDTIGTPGIVSGVVHESIPLVPIKCTFHFQTFTFLSVVANNSYVRFVT